MNKTKSNDQLNGWITGFGVLFFVLAAACEFQAAFATDTRVTPFRQMLSKSSVTASEIQAAVAATASEMSQPRATPHWFFYAGFAFMMLGLVCLLLRIHCGLSQRADGGNT